MLVKGGPDSVWGLVEYGISIQNSFAHNLFHICPIILEFAQSDTPMLCKKNSNDWTFEMDFMNGLDFGRFKSKMIFGQIFCIAQSPRYLKKSFGS